MNFLILEKCLIHRLESCKQTEMVHETLQWDRGRVAQRNWRNCTSLFWGAFLEC